MRKCIIIDRFTGIAAVVPAFLIMLASYAECNKTLVILWFTLSMGFMGTFYPGNLKQKIEKRTIKLIQFSFFLSRNESESIRFKSELRWKSDGCNKWYWCFDRSSCAYARRRADTKRKFIQYIYGKLLNSTVWINLTFNTFTLFHLKND